MVNSPVLVLNQNYEPLNICRARRAIVLVYWGKAELVANGAGEISSANQLFLVPSVIRLCYLIKRPRHTRRLTRLEVFNRDGYACQYCGKESRQLTLDHVLPRFRGGEHTWENVVSACIPCNHRKAGRTPTEAGMKLLCRPRVPRDGTLFVPYFVLQNHREWLQFLPHYPAKAKEKRAAHPL